MVEIYKLFTDGGSRGNPGKAACGAVIFDKDDKVIVAKGKFLGINTNNFGEYEGLIMGLTMAVEKEITNLNVFMDSELIVNQLLGKYRVKDSVLKGKYEIVKELIKKFDEFSVVHVTRDKNKYADKLVNDTLDNN